MKLIIGLGNPGKKYEKTRHNFGFLAIDWLKANGDDFEKWTLHKDINSFLSEGKINDEKIILAKPQTFMNSSGKATKSLIDFYKAPIPDIFVIHDDVDLPLGVLRLSKNASAAGHKGVQSIIDSLGSKNFVRFRLGIHPIGQTLACANFKKNSSTEKFVLKKFSRPEMILVNKIIKKTASAIETVLKIGLEKAMSKFN